MSNVDKVKQLLGISLDTDISELEPRFKEIIEEVEQKE